MYSNTYPRKDLALFRATYSTAGKYPTLVDRLDTIDYYHYTIFQLACTGNELQVVNHNWNAFPKNQNVFLSH